MTVERRQTLYGLAEKHFGVGEKWTTIRDANVGRTMGDGTLLGDSFTTITAGWTLIIPRATVNEHQPTPIVEPDHEPDLPVADAPIVAEYDDVTGQYIVGSYHVEERRPLLEDLRNSAH